MRQGHLPKGSLLGRPTAAQQTSCFALKGGDCPRWSSGSVPADRVGKDLGVRQRIQHELRGRLYRSGQTAELWSAPADGRHWTATRCCEDVLLTVPPLPAISSTRSIKGERKDPLGLLRARNRAVANLGNGAVASCTTYNRSQRIVVNLAARPTAARAVSAVQPSVPRLRG